MLDDVGRGNFSNSGWNAHCISFEADRLVSPICA